MYRIFMLF